MKRKEGTFLIRAGLLASLYAVLTLVPPLNSISYGPVQLRVSEMLTVLPFFFDWAPWGLYLGCVAANLGSPFFMYDVTLGALATLTAALATSKIKRPFLAPLPPVIANSLIVGFYVAKLSNLGFWPVALNIGLGEVAVCYGMGYPLLVYIGKNHKLRKFMDG